MPTYLHDIILLYLMVLDDRGSSDPAERDLVIRLAQRWATDTARTDIEAVVETAALAIRSGLHRTPKALARDLCETLQDDCKRLLSDLGALARADGHLTQHEAETISLVRTVLSQRRYGAGTQAST